MRRLMMVLSLLGCDENLGTHALDGGALDGGALDAQAQDAQGRSDAHSPVDAMALDAHVTPDAQSCQWPDGAERRTAEPFELGGQAGWRHDDGAAYGFFHTYDALQVCGEGDAARKVHVLLPRDYESTQARYPVVYMNDGQAAFWPDAFGTWAVQDALGRLDPCRIEPVIVVAIHPLERDREYTHTPWHDDRACCGLPQYAAYVADCVRPFVDGNYRTQVERAVTMGSSHGGLAAFYTAVTRSDVFSGAIAMSPSVWAGVDYNREASDTPLAGSALLDAVESGLAARPRLWLDWGLSRTGGYHNAVIEARATTRTQELGALLLAQFGYVEGASLFLHEDPIGGHEEASWGGRLPLALEAFFPKQP